MKKKAKGVKLFFVTSITLLTSSSGLIAQNSWQTTGNNALPPNAINGASFIGSTINVPFQLRTTLAQPMLFQTTNLERMRITPTGEVGIGQITPLSFLHLNSNGNALAGQVFRTTSLTDGYWKMCTGAGNGTERFRIYTQPNPFNVFFETTTQNAIFGIRTGNIGTVGLRFLVNGQASTNATSGRIATNFS